MSAMTPSPGTPASPQLPRRTNRSLIWTKRILLGLLALIVLIAVSELRRSWQRRREAISSSRTTGGYRRPPLASELRRARQPHRSARCRIGRVLSGLGCYPAPDCYVDARLCVRPRRPRLERRPPGPLPRSPQQFADELHLLLTNAGVEGPYVLVVPLNLRQDRTADCSASTRTRLRGWCSSTRGTSPWTSTSAGTDRRRGRAAAAVPEHDRVDGEVRAGAAAQQSASVAEGSAWRRISLQRRGPPSASCRRAHGRSRTLWLRGRGACKATLSCEGRHPLATSHSSSWRQRTEHRSPVILEGRTTDHDRAVAEQSPGRRPGRPRRSFRAARAGGGEHWPGRQCRVQVSR